MSIYLGGIYEGLHGTDRENWFPEIKAQFTLGCEEQGKEAPVGLVSQLLTRAPEADIHESAQQTERLLNKAKEETQQQFNAGKANNTQVLYGEVGRLGEKGIDKVPSIPSPLAALGALFRRSN